MRFDKHGLLIICTALAVAWSGCSQLKGAAKKATGSNATADKIEKSAQEAKEAKDKTAESSGGSSEAPEPKPPMKKTANVPPLPDGVKIQAAPGVRTVEPAKPDFCSGEFDPAIKRVAEDADNLAKKLEKKIDYVEQTWAELACTYGTNKNMQAWVASFKQRLVNRYGMPEWALSEYLNYHLTHSSADIMDELEAHTACEAAPKPNNGTPMEEAFNDMMRGFYCGGQASSGLINDAAWFYDRTAEPPSELHRGAFVYGTLGEPEGQEADLGLLEWKESLFARFVFVRNDWAAMDEDAFKEELAQQDLDTYERWHAIKAYFGAKRHGQQLALGYAELGDKSELYKTVTSTVAQKAFEDWTASYEKNKEMVDTVLEVERAWMEDDQSVLDGCHERLRADVTSYIQARKPTSKADVQNAAATPMGYIALTALALCEEINGFELRAMALKDLSSGSATWRGPRTQVMMDAYREIAAADDDDFDIDPMLPFIGSGGRNGLFTTGRGNYMASVGVMQHKSYANGVIKSITDEGGLKKVSFYQRTYAYPIIRCKEVTPRVIERIKPDGTLVYRRDCRQVGEEKVKKTPKPVLMHADLADKLEKGNFIHALKLETDQGIMAYPITHYASKDKKELVSYYGIPLQ